MPFNDSPLPRTQRSLDERRAQACAAMRRAAWMSYLAGALNVVSGYLVADAAATVGLALLPAMLGALLVLCGLALHHYQSRAAAVGLLLTTVAIFVARWTVAGKVGAVLPGVVALYLFWQGWEAASEWARLRDHELPASGALERAN